MKDMNDGYIDLLMKEWGMERCSRTMQACMRWALRPYPGAALLILRREPRLQVEILSWVPETVWAYFPIHHGQIADQYLNSQLKFIIKNLGLHLKDEAHVLLLLGTRRKPGETADDCGVQLLHHFGHIFLYLRTPKSRNECDDARRENARLCGWKIPKKVRSGKKSCF